MYTGETTTLGSTFVSFIVEMIVSMQPLAQSVPSVGYVRGETHGGSNHRGLPFCLLIAKEKGSCLSRSAYCVWLVHLSSVSHACRTPGRSFSYSYSFVCVETVVALLESFENVCSQISDS